MGAPAGKKTGTGKKVVSKFVLDCTEPVNDNVLDAASFVSDFGAPGWWRE
jgi:hypothetical protein